MTRVFTSRLGRGFSLLCAGIVAAAGWSWQSNAQTPRNQDDATYRSEYLNDGVYQIRIAAYVYDLSRRTEYYTMTGVLVKEPNLILTTQRSTGEATPRSLFGPFVEPLSAYYICEAQPDPTRLEAAKRRYEEAKGKDKQDTARDQARFDAAEAKAKQDKRNPIEKREERYKNQSTWFSEREFCVEANVKKVDADRRLVLLETVDRLSGGVPSFNTVDPEVGNAVRAYGFPSASANIATRRSTTAERQISRLIPTITSGTIAKNETDKKEGQIIVHQVPVSEGAWGGPLVNSCGQIIGLNDAPAGVVRVIEANATDKSVTSNKREAAPSTRNMPTSNLVTARGSRELRDFAELNGFTVPTVSAACADKSATFSFRDNPLHMALIGGTLLVALAALVLALRKPSVRHTVARFFPGGSRATQDAYAGGYAGSPYSAPAANQPTADYSPYAPTASPIVETVQSFAPPTNRADATRILDQADSGVKLVPVEGGSPIMLNMGQLGSGGLVLGRGTESDIVVDSSTVSKRHARLTLAGNKLQIDDLGSANGTYRGKARIQRESFGNGDTVRFGSVEFKCDIAPNVGGVTVIIGQPPSWIMSGFDEQGRVVQWELKPKVDASSRPIETQWIIGRNAERADLVLSDKRISGEHARLRWTPQRGLEICDLGSSNGTKVDGNKVTDHHVAINDARAVEFGGSKMALTKT